MDMKSKKMKNFIKASLLASTLGVTVLFIGHGCSDVGGSKKGAAASLATGAAGQDDITIIPNTKTVSTVYAKQFMDNMVSCTGLQIESARTRGEWENRKGSLSEFGYATDVTPPMLMSIAAVAGEVCSDLIDKEKAAANPIIFDNFNLSGMTNQSEVGDAIQRIALSCWHRRASDSEVTLISNLVSDAADNMNGEQSALLLCATMLASYKSIEM